jgi:hypothetical protein
MFFLKRNLPVWERFMRVAAGAVVAWLLLSGQLHGMMYWAGIATAATLVLTAFVGFCPACAMIGRRYLDQ